MNVLDAIINKVGDKFIGSIDAVLQHKKFIVFGASLAGKLTKKYLRERGIETIFFCDNDVKKHETKLDGVIVSPDYLKKCQGIPVAIGSSYAYEIARQLQSLASDISYFDIFSLTFFNSDKEHSLSFYKDNEDAIEYALAASPTRSPGTFLRLLSPIA